MDTEKKNDKEQMAMLRFSLIAPIINNTYPQGSKRAYYRDVAKKCVVLPNGSQVYFNPNTLSTWESRYRRLGFEGLMQQGRTDAGHPRRISADQASAIAALKQRFPKMNATQVRMKLIEDGILDDACVSISTIQRYIKRTFARGAENPGCKDRKAFEEEFSNGMWQADTLYGPYVTYSNKLCRSYLQMIIDDRSRMIIAGKFYLADNASNFQLTLKSGACTYGIPRKIYVDNGAPYRNAALVGICGRIGCVLIHTPVRDGASKGKVERNFRTLRERYLNCLDIANRTYTLDELNDSLALYIIKHNSTIHHAHGEKPLDVWSADALKIPPRMPLSPQWITECFRNHERRLVHKDSTVSINKISFDAPAHMIGSKAEVVFTPGNTEDVWVIDEDKTLIHLQLTDRVANGRTKRKNTYAIDYTQESKVL